MLKALLKIRLSYIYPSLFIIFFIILTFYKRQSLTPGQLALFSVNSFLFGYYFGPILSAQKARVDGLIKAVRQEVMAILDVLTQSHFIKEHDRHELKLKLRAYIDSIMSNEAVQADNERYNELLRFTKSKKFEGNSTMDAIYARLVKTQENRDNLAILYQSKLFSHEWLVVLVLFSVTLFFTLQTDYGNVLFFRVLLSVLCTGISLLIVILAKYATLTHKQAKRIWVPMKELIANHFEDIDAVELKKEEAAR